MLSPVLNIIEKGMVPSEVSSRAHLTVTREVTTSACSSSFQHLLSLRIIDGCELFDRLSLLQYRSRECFHVGSDDISQILPR